MSTSCGPTVHQSSLYHSTPHCPTARCSILCRPAQCNPTAPVTRACHPSPCTPYHRLHVLLCTVQTSTVSDTNSLHRSTLVLRQSLAVQPRLASATCQFSCLSLLNFEKTGTTHHCPSTALHHCVMCHHAHDSLFHACHPTHPTPYISCHTIPYHASHMTLYNSGNSITPHPHPSPAHRTFYITHPISHYSTNSSYPTAYIPTTYHMLHILQHTFHSTHLFYIFHTIHPIPYI